MGLIYCSHPTLETQEPDWVQKLANNTILQVHGYAVYRPMQSLAAQLENEQLLSAFKQSVRPIFGQLGDVIGLDDSLQLPFEDAQPYLQVSDSPEPSVLLPFKDMYALLRADVVVFDMSRASFGEHVHELVYATIGKIPVIGLTTRFVNPPWIMDKISVALNPKTSDQIAQLVMGLTDNLVADMRRSIQTKAPDSPKEPQSTSLDGKRVQFLKDLNDGARRPTLNAELADKLAEAAKQG